MKGGMSIFYLPQNIISDIDKEIVQILLKMKYILEEKLEMVTLGIGSKIRGKEGWRRAMVILFSHEFTLETVLLFL